MKKIKLSTAVGLIILSVITTINGTLLVSYEIINSKQGDYIGNQNKFSKLSEVIGVIDTYYVGDINSQQALEGAVAGYVFGVGDRWSQYLTTEQYADYRTNDEANLVGIGVNVVYDTEKKAILVTNVYKDSPAEKAGLRKLDYITAVDSKSVEEHGYTTIVDAVRGEEGTSVLIEVERNEERQSFNIKREEVAKVSVSAEMIENDIGYIKISEFESTTAEQFKTAIDELLEDGANKFVFDLRNNPGGLLTKLVECLDLLVPEGNVISTVSKVGDENVYLSDASYLNLPISVIVNESSYSAAEFFASAIQEYEVGTIVGTKTTGKGYSQVPIELSDGSAVILSTNKYYTPKGESLADTGVVPDIIVELTEQEEKDYYHLTMETDPQIKAAIDALK